ncbi:MAG: hypothetical protein NTY48_02525 [Candidatus Diapherotrites archaeon]|nr:hypothetical protein [Candidatus Diapherotrites archaeon]
MITSLTLKNWRTHAETVLEFGKGTNVIVGVMGSGKSSIVNAISYALFGTFPAVKGRSVTLEEIIMNKPNSQSRAEITLDFEQGGVKYKVERIIKRDGTNEAKLYGNARLIAGPKQKDVNEKVENLLGLNYELFSRAVYSEQNEMDFFLKLTPSARKIKFDELLELAKYEEARKNSVTLQNELAKENKQRKEFIEQQKKTIQSHEEEKLQKQIAEEKAEIALLEKEILKVRKEVLSIETEFKVLAEKERQNKLLEDQILKLNFRIESLKLDVSKSDKITIEEVLKRIEKLKTEVILIKEKTAHKEKEYKENDLESKKASEETRVFEYEKKKLLAEETGIIGLKGKCPTCQQELTEEHKKSLRNEITAKVKELEVKIKETEQRKKNFSEKARSAEKEKEEMQKETDEKSREVYKLEAAQKQALEIKEKKKQLKIFEEELPKTKKQLLEVGFDKKKLEITREEIYAKKSSASVSESRIKSKLELKKSYENTLEKIGLIRKTIEENGKLVTGYDEAVKNIGIFANCLVATQIELRTSMIETINNAMSTIWQAIYPYKDFIDAKLSIVSDGYDLEVLTRNNQWVRVEGILSGGERSAAALCIRIAFALVLTKKLSMLILDEPTHNLDSNAVLKLSEMLREELPRLVEQIFVITHDKELESAASSNLYLLSRNKNNDEATKVDLLETTH